MANASRKESTLLITVNMSELGVPLLPRLEVHSIKKVEGVIRSRRSKKV